MRYNIKKFFLSIFDWITEVQQLRAQTMLRLEKERVARLRK